MEEDVQLLYSEYIYRVIKGTIRYSDVVYDATFKWLIRIAFFTKRRKSRLQIIGTKCPHTRLVSNWRYVLRRTIAQARIKPRL